MKFAVVTEALSPEFYFPKWYSYYSRFVNSSDLYVAVPGGSPPAFSHYALGGVIAFPSERIDETVRTSLVGGLVTTLLSCYDAVIRVDTDEFLIPDPRKHADLGQYMHSLKLPFVTAVGLDVFQHTSEASANLSEPLLRRQRRFAYLSSSMCKTAITSVPIQWGPGFHYCTHFPHMNDLFLLHLKRADIDQQIHWFDHVSKREFSQKEMKEYYSPDIDKITNFHRIKSGLNLKRGWQSLDDSAFLNKFNREIRFNERDKIYRGSHFQASEIVELPDEFRDVI